jgi:predicted ATP-grasp superfamily ATP-dependent carboligase
MLGARSAEVRRDRRPPVLVSDHVDGRSRSAVAAVRALALAGYRPVVSVSGGRSAAAASRGCASVLRVPAPGSPGHRRTIEHYLAEHPPAVVLAASDAVLVELELPGADLVDKSTLPKLAAAAGLTVPSTQEFPSGAALAGIADELEYPLVVKAAVKTGTGDNTRRIDSADELRSAFESTPDGLVAQQFATGDMRAVCGVIGDGRLLAVVHQAYVRIWPPGCGTASAAVTTAPDHALEERLPALLAGHSGVFQVQLIGDQVIDVNPRVYGSLPLAVAAGANLPAIACRAAAGSSPSSPVRAREGVRYRWLEGDVRRLLHDVRTGALTAGAAARAMRPRRGTAHSIESLRDPGPGLVRLLDAASRKMA